MRLLRPVAAAYYFLKPRGLGWFATNIIGIIPVARGRAKEGGNPLAECEAALDRDDILIHFPEGSRGVPEALGLFKKGIGHLAKARANVPVIPVFMHGLGKALPKGSALLVPFNCAVSVGEPVYGQDSTEALVRELEAAMTALAAQKRVPAWD
jgi:1-acyl-sn-glycerol-3-phosphate acyltransferase